MAILTVASIGNDATILPALLAAAHAIRSNPHNGIVIEYKDLASLGKGGEKVKLTMENGDVIANEAVVSYFLDECVLPKGKKSQVCWRYHSSSFMVSDSLLGR